MKREWPSSSESMVRMEAPTDSGEMIRLRARTGAPASASTALMPTARSSVLLPDMFEPLTTYRLQRRPKCHGVAYAPVVGSRGWPSDSPSKPRPLRMRGTGLRGARKNSWRARRAPRFPRWRQPAFDVPAVLRTPGFDRHGGLNGPEQGSVEYANDEVVARIEQFHKAPQSGDALRGGPPFDIKRGAQCPQAGRLEAVGLEHGHDLREEIEIAGRVADLFHDGRDALLHGEEEQPFDGNHGDYGAARADVHEARSQPPEHDARARDGEDQGGQPGGERERVRGSARPCNQAFGIDPGAVFIAQNGEVFAKVEQRPEFDDRGVAFEQFIRRRRGLQPGSQADLASARAGGRKQMEHAAFAKQIQVGGVGMMGIDEALAGLTNFLPAVFDPRDARLVECDGAPDQLSAALNDGLPADESNEDCNRAGDGPGIYLAANGEPDAPEDDGHGKQAPVSDPVLRGFERLQRLGACGEPLLVDHQESA